MGFLIGDMCHLRATDCNYYLPEETLSSVLASPVSSLMHYFWQEVVGQWSMKEKFA